MKRSLYLALTVLAIVSMALVAWHKPGYEKDLDEFYGTLACDVAKEGELVDLDHFMYYKDRELSCKLTSADDHVAGELAIKYMKPRYKYYGQEHTQVVQLNLVAGSIKWIGYAWGRVARNGDLTLVNGYMITPEQGYYLRHIAWLSFDMPSLYGSYETRGD
jgi:hypothetical protein